MPIQEFGILFSEVTARSGAAASLCSETGQSSEGAEVLRDSYREKLSLARRDIMLHPVYRAAHRQTHTHTHKHVYIYIYYTHIYATLGQLRKILIRQLTLTNRACAYACRLDLPGPVSLDECCFRRTKP